MPGVTADGYALYTVRKDEFAEHLKKRFEYHTQRNRNLLERANNLKATLDKTVDDQETVSDRMAVKGSYGYGNDSRERDRLFESAREEARKAARFSFLSKHLPVGDDLQLAEVELVNLEFFQE